MPKVFPIHETKFPIDSAGAFGIIQPPIFTDIAYPTGKGSEAVSLRKRQLLVILEERMENFNPKEDYLLIVGDPIFIGLAMDEAIILAGNQDITSIKVLRYDKALGRYLDIDLVVDFYIEDGNDF